QGQGSRVTERFFRGASQRVALQQQANGKEFGQAARRNRTRDTIAACFNVLNNARPAAQSEQRLAEECVPLCVRHAERGERSENASPRGAACVLQASQFRPQPAQPALRRTAAHAVERGERVEKPSLAVWQRS